ncbi:unnamed protein product [Paramecium sonneborni]|uniref:Uncharacterized protein n=1 Tax=Paramecium sonneborni TaxID=65129 RepID=A0A8S1P6V1_9CILI|nr:unnamed protein product [Paramecium sonneborni]
MSYSQQFSIILVGDTCVGKTSLLYRFKNSEFKQNQIQATFGVNFELKIIQLDDLNIQLKIWDTAGQERCQSFTKSFFRSTLGVIMVYDITRSSTLKTISQWLEQIKQDDNFDFSLTLVGNKNDLEEQREVSKAEAITFARNNDIDFLEVSVKTGENVEEVFLKTAKNILQKIDNNKIDLSKQSNGIRIGSEINIKKQLKLQPKSKENKGCC